MDLRQIRYFLAIADSGSFLHAAALLRISQPALTRSIRMLEQSLQVKLFERHARGIRMTMQGETLYNYAKSVVTELGRAAKELQALETAPGGTITVGALPSVGNIVLPDVMLDFTQKYSNTRVRIVERPNIELIPGLAQGNYDFVLGVIEGNLAEKGFVYEPLLHDRLVVTARPHHPLASFKKVSAATLSRAPWILPASGTLHRRRLDDLFHSAGLVTPRSSLECGSLQFIRAMLAKSDYVALLPESCMRAEVQAGILAILNLDARIRLRPVGLITRPAHAMPAAGKALIEIIRTACNGLK